MANVKNNTAAQETQRRLLEAAGEVFAERGFHAATIKEITDRAGAALASVNYHFRDKAELYAAVLRRIEADAAEIIPPDAALTGAAPARLRQFVRHVVTTMLGRGQPAWERVLLARELAQPSPALDPLIDTVARPLHEKLAALVAEVTGQDASGEAVALATASIVGQCVYYLEHQSMLQRVHPRLAGGMDPERVADHVAQFCLAALRPATGDGGLGERRRKRSRGTVRRGR
jgi:AcrR family transcriptional regulator